MKTSDIKTTFILIMIAVMAPMTLTNCSKNNSDNMVWSVTSQDQEHIEVTFDPARSQQIEIVASSEGGQCRLSCPNYQNISFRERNIRTNLHKDYHCMFQAEITSPGVITVTFNQMSKEDENFSSYFMIDGENGSEIDATVVKVTRRLQEKKLIPVSHTNMASLDY